MNKGLHLNAVYLTKWTDTWRLASSPSYPRDFTIYRGDFDETENIRCLSAVSLERHSSDGENHQKGQATAAGHSEDHSLEWENLSSSLKRTSSGTERLWQTGSLTFNWRKRSWSREIDSARLQDSKAIRLTQAVRDQSPSLYWHRKVAHCKWSSLIERWCHSISREYGENDERRGNRDSSASSASTWTSMTNFLITEISWKSHFEDWAVLKSHLFGSFSHSVPSGQYFSSWMCVSRIDHMKHSRQVLRAQCQVPLDPERSLVRVFAIGQVRCARSGSLLDRAKHKGIPGRCCEMHLSALVERLRRAALTPSRSAYLSPLKSSSSTKIRTQTSVVSPVPFSKIFQAENNSKVEGRLSERSQQGCKWYLDQLIGFRAMSNG
jgi:hypothetical protein